jgi:hypothetical protein
VPLDIVATFEETRSGKPKEDLWLPISKDRKEAERGRLDAEKRAQELFEEHRRKMGISTVVAVVRVVHKTPQQRCTDFYSL